MSERKFDFEKFAVAIIRTVDSIRSKGKNGNESFVEHRIDAFYRLLGLPAVLLGEGYPKSVRNDNNGNLFDGDLGLSEERKKYLARRQFLFVNPVKPDEGFSFLDYNKNKVTDSVAEKDPDRRASGGLFPMVVNGATEIFPLSRRVAQAFTAEKLLKRGKVRYNQPLLETIISLKRKREGLYDTNTQSGVTLTVVKEMAAICEEIEEILKEKTFYIGDVVETTTELLGRARAKTGADVSSANDSTAQGKKIMEHSKEKAAALDVQIDKQQKELDIKNARLAIFDYDDTWNIKNKDEDKDAKKVSTTRNLRSPLCANEVLDLALSTESVEKSMKEAKKKLSKSKKDIESSFRSLDLVLGTYSGLSGTDVLAVITALFRMESKDLVKLLNKTGRENIPVDVSGDVSAEAVAAIEMLEGHVKDIIEEIHKEILEKAPKEKATKQKRRRKKKEQR